MKTFQLSNDLTLGQAYLPTQILERTKVLTFVVRGKPDLNESNHRIESWWNIYRRLPFLLIPRPHTHESFRLAFSDLIVSSRSYT